MRFMGLYQQIDSGVRHTAWWMHDAVGWPFQALLRSAAGLWIRRNTEPSHWTLLRFPLTLIIALLFMFRHDGWALGVYVLAVLTDRFDGEFARLDHKCTPFGTLLDTVSDSVMQSALLLSLAGRYPTVLADVPGLRLPIVAICLEIVRLIGGLLLRVIPYVTRRHTESAFQPNMSGKFKMAAMALSVVAILLQRPTLAQHLMWWAIGLSVYSLLRHLLDIVTAPRLTPQSND